MTVEEDLRKRTLDLIREAREFTKNNMDNIPAEDEVSSFLSTTARYEQDGNFFVTEYFDLLREGLDMHKSFMVCKEIADRWLSAFNMASQLIACLRQKHELYELGVECDDSTQSPT